MSKSTNNPGLPAPIPMPCSSMEGKKMSESISKCCGAEVIHHRTVIHNHKTVFLGEVKEDFYECKKCHKPTEVEEKEEEKGK